MIIHKTEGPKALTHYGRYLDAKTLARVSSLELRARVVVEGMMSGQHRSPFQGSSSEFAQHRPYVQGDDIRKVDWKLVARSNKIYLKQYQEETNFDLVLAVDCSQSMAYGSQVVKTEGSELASGGVWTKYDTSVSAAAALAYLATRQQDSVGLGMFDQGLARYFKASSSVTQWKLIVGELLAVPRWNGTATAKSLEQLAGKLTHRSIVVILSDFFDDLGKLEKAFSRLRHARHEVIALQVLDGAELEFPFDGVTLFEGLEEAGELLTEPKSLQKAYQREIGQFCADLGRVCRAMGVDFGQIRTDEPLDVALARMLGKRMAVRS